MSINHVVDSRIGAAPPPPSDPTAALNAEAAFDENQATVDREEEARDRAQEESDRQDDFLENSALMQSRSMIVQEYDRRLGLSGLPLVVTLNLVVFTRRREERRQRAEQRRQRADARNARADIRENNRRRRAVRQADYEYSVAEHEREIERYNQEREEIASEYRTDFRESTNRAIEESESDRLRAQRSPERFAANNANGNFETSPMTFGEISNRNEFKNLEEEKNPRNRITLDSGFDLEAALQEASFSPKRPEIIAKIPLFQILRNQNVNDLHELRQYEKHLGLESLDKTWDQFINLAGQSINNEMLQNSSNALDEDEKNLSFFSDLREMMDSTIDLLDVRSNSKQLTLSAKNFAQNLLTELEGDFESYPGDIDTFISRKCGFSSLSPKCFSNTKLIHTILREFSNSINSFYPKLLDNARREDKSSFRFSTYEPLGRGTKIPNVSEFGSRSLAFTTANGRITTLRYPVTDSYVKSLPSIENFNKIDRIKILSVLLHNELVVSSGISRLFGSPLANKYGTTSNDPVERIIGGYFKNSSSVLSGAGAAGSYSDFLVLREFTKARDESLSLILPFEKSAIKDANGRTHLPGSSFFVENPIRRGETSTSLSQFASSISELDADGQTILKTLLCLDQECKFEPADIVMRCLKALRDVAAILSTNSLTNKVSLKTSLPIAFLTELEKKTFRSSVNAFGKTRNNPIELFFTMCVRRRLRFDLNVLRLGEDTSYAERIPTKSFARMMDVENVHPVESDDLALNEESLLFEGAFLNNISWPGQAPGGIDANKFISEEIDNIGLNYGWEPNVPDTIYDDILVKITSVLRSIQDDVFELSRKNDTNISYLDDNKLTRYNRWDDNTMLASVFEIFRCLISQLFPSMSITKSRKSDKDHLSVSWDDLGILRLKDFLDIFINQYDSKQPISEIFDSNGQCDSIYSISKTTKFSPEGMSAGQLVNIVESLIDQRKFIKICLGYVTSIVKNINDADLKLTEFFKMNESDSGDNVERINRLKAQKAGDLSISMLTAEQNSLKKLYALSKVPSPRSSAIKKSLLSTSEEDDVLEYFLGEMSTSSANDGVAICTGLPMGLVRGLRDPVRNEEPTGEDVSADTFLSNLGLSSTRLVSIVYNKVSESHPEIEYASVDANFDAQIFILPGDLKFSQESPAKSLRSIVDGTTFTRITNGRINSSKLGSEIIANEELPLEVLENHVIDRIYKIFSYNVMGVSFDESLWFLENTYSSNIIDNTTFNLLERILSNPSIASELKINLNSIKLIFENISSDGLTDFKKLCSSQKLKKFLKSNVSFSSIDNLIKIVANANLNTQVESHRTICPRYFDRVFVTIFSNNSSRNQFMKSFVVNDVACKESDFKRLKISKNYFDMSGYMCSIKLV
jgi:hypothetical protein